MAQTNEQNEPRLYGSAEGASMAPLAPGMRMRKFQFTALDANSNKWYVYELHIDPARPGYSNVRGLFGRVGDRGQVKEYGPMTEDGFERLVRERLRKGYVEVELAQVKPSSSTSAMSVVSNTPEDRLVSLIYREAGETIKEYLAADVDALSLQQIELGRALLDTINHTRGMYGIQNIGRGAGAPDRAKVMLRNLAQSTVVDAVEAYYKAIPTILPRRIDPHTLAGGFDVVEQETRLNQLEAAIQTIHAQSSGQTQRQALDDVEIVWLDPKQEAYASLKHYAESTGKRAGYSYGAGGGYGSIRVQDIYSVTIPQERERYKAFLEQTYNWSSNPSHAVAGKKMLFHGSRNGNWRHILKGGLRIMSSAQNGRALGDGLYFANQSAKSANYCSTAGHADAPLIMMLSEVALGRMSERSGWQGRQPPPGYDSVYSRAHGSYAYDEYCIFEAARCTARYLITFRT